ncbi:hypothetical protein ACN4EK_11460 [Pantanalinema rosaneae CENA516]|uniref:hypothetical protein n=1 Tax=Pantanalinema rosaneae TaxID=1620701 RepID=UPI003D6F965B
MAFGQSSARSVRDDLPNAKPVQAIALSLVGCVSANVTHRFHDREQLTEVFLRSPGLLPFAVLSQTSDRTQVLRQVAQAIDRIANRQTQSNITASAYILAGLVLEKEVVGQVLRRDMMQESVTYQEIRQEGEQSKAQQIALNMIREGMALEAIARVTGLSIEQVEQLQDIASQHPQT